VVFLLVIFAEPPEVDFSAILAPQVPMWRWYLLGFQVGSWIRHGKDTETLGHVPDSLWFTDAKDLVRHVHEVAREAHIRASRTA
jgi:hypothetical protein